MRFLQVCKLFCFKLFIVKCILFSMPIVWQFLYIFLDLLFIFLRYHTATSIYVKRLNVSDKMSAEEENVPAKLNKSHIDLLLNIPDSWMLRYVD